MDPRRLTDDERKRLPAHTAVTYGANQPEYIPLPAARLHNPEGSALTRWSLSDEERRAIAEGADVYLEQLTFGQRLQPVRLSVGWPTYYTDLERR